MSAKLQLIYNQKILDKIDIMAEKRGLNTKKAFFDNALALLFWAIEETEKGRSIVSIDEKEKVIREAVLPILSIEREFQDNNNINN